MAIEILRPSAAGDEENLPVVVGDGSGSHYATVDEASSDDDTSYVEDNDPTPHRDLYNLPPSSGSGTINKITVKAHCRNTSTPFVDGLWIACKSGTTADESASIRMTNSYATYNNEWALNPDDSAAWEWADIDDLQIGIKMRQVASSVYSRCTQVWVEIDYVVGGVNYPISLSPGLTASATLAYLVAFDRGMNQGLTISATVSAVFGRLITTISNLTVNTTISRKLAYARASVANLTVAVIILKGWGRAIATSADLTVSTTISRAVAFSRTMLAGLTTAVSLTRSVVWKRTIAANLVISVILAGARAFLVTITANLTVSVVIRYCVVLKELVRIPIDALDTVRMSISRMGTSRVPISRKEIWRRIRSCFP